MGRWYGALLASPLVVLAWLPVLALPAAAHEVVTGVQGLPSLVLHPFVAVETVLPLIGFALVAGAADRLPALLPGMAVLLAGAAAGAFLQPSLLMLPGLWRFPLLLAFGLGALAATGWSLRPRWVLLAGVLVAASLGMALPPERSGLLGRLEVTAAALLALLVALGALAWPRKLFRHHWPVRVAGQVLGAWIVAISLLGLAVSMR